MSESRKSPPGAIGLKHGMPIYETNPSIPPPQSVTTTRKAAIGTPAKGLVIDGAGEVFGPGTAIAYEWEEVDQERFVKLFLAGLKSAAGLTKAGMAVFELVYEQVRMSPNSDRVMLSAYAASRRGITERTYQRGLRELLDREFLYRSPYDGAFFINVRFLFNGDRLAFVKAYHLKETKVLPGNGSVST